MAGGTLALAESIVAVHNGAPRPRDHDDMRIGEINVSPVGVKEWKKVATMPAAATVNTGFSGSSASNSSSSLTLPPAPFSSGKVWGSSVLSLPTPSSSSSSSSNSSSNSPTSFGGNGFFDLYHGAIPLSPPRSRVVSSTSSSSSGSSSFSRAPGAGVVRPTTTRASDLYDAVSVSGSAVLAYL